MATERRRRAPRGRPPQPIGAPAQPAPRQAPRPPTLVVRASELGSYAYCRRAWWLRHVARVEPAAAGQARFDPGHLRHAEHGRGLWLAGVLWKLGLACGGVAGLIALLWLLIALLAH